MRGGKLVAKPPRHLLPVRIRPMSGAVCGGLCGAIHFAGVSCRKLLPVVSGVKLGGLPYR